MRASRGASPPPQSAVPAFVASAELPGDASLGESARADGGSEIESLKSISDTVRVDIRKLDELMNLVGELVIQRGAIGALADRLLADPSTARVGRELSKLHKSLERRLADLQAGVLEVRMVPLRQVFEKLSRVVRRLRRDLGKEVRLDIRGGPRDEQLARTRAAVRDELINRELVAQEAARTGTAKNRDVQLQLEIARQEVLVGAYLNDYLRTHPVTDADVQKEYDRARAQTGATEYRARHILVESEEEAKRLIAELKKGGKFEELARKSSKDEGTRERGGDLDWSVPAAFDKAFADALVKLQKGQITTEPVQSRFGFHVIQLEDQRAVSFPPLAQVKPQIQQRLARQKVETLIRGLRAKAKVE